MTEQDGEDEREEELSSIAAIFPELTRDAADPFTATVELSVSPTTPLAVIFPSATDGAPPTDYADAVTLHSPPSAIGSPVSAQEIYHLSHLPPLRLKVTLPEGYPARAPPLFEIATAPTYVPHSTLHTLQGEGRNLWEEYGRGQTVFAFIDFLQQGAERAFDLDKNERGVFEATPSLKSALLEYDVEAKRKKFEQGTFDCGICLEPKKGSVCHRLQECGHVFCVPCLQDFFNKCISEGDISNVRCIDPDCGKESGASANGQMRKKKTINLNPSELLQIPLGESTVVRYVQLKRKKLLESDKSTIYCPRKWCQGPARSKRYPKNADPFAVDLDESEDDDELTPRATPDPNVKPDRGSTERLAICEDCTFAFCRVCLASWHGDYVRCWPRDESELSVEEKASYDYIRMHTSPCPTCNSPCQKTHGCNHMNCFQCHTHFCYLCSSWLDPQNPYQHFNRKELACYMRLWELEEGDEGQGNVRFDGARGWEAALEAANEAEQEEQRQVPQQPAQPHPQVEDVVDDGLQAGMQNLAMDEAPQPMFRMPPRAAPRRRQPLEQAQVAPDQGLQRFLAMVQNDEEDGWDSDEMGDDDEFQIPVW